MFVNLIKMQSKNQRDFEPALKSKKQSSTTAGSQVPTDTHATASSSSKFPAVAPLAVKISEEEDKLGTAHNFF